MTLGFAEESGRGDAIEVSISSQLAPDLLKPAEGLEPPVMNGSDIAMGGTRLALH